MQTIRRSAPIRASTAVLVVLLSGCTSVPLDDPGSCARPAGDDGRVDPLPAGFDPLALEGRLALDSGTTFSLSAAGDDRFTGFWEDGAPWTVIGRDGRDLGKVGGWFCAERMPERVGTGIP